MLNRFVGDYVLLQIIYIDSNHVLFCNLKKITRNMLPIVQISKEMVFKLTDPLTPPPPNFAILKITFYN